MLYGRTTQGNTSQGMGSHRLSYEATTMHLKLISRDAANPFNAHTEIEDWDGELQTTNAHRTDRPKRRLHTTNRDGCSIFAKFTAGPIAG